MEKLLVARPVAFEANDSALGAFCGALRVIFPVSQLAETLIFLTESELPEKISFCCFSDEIYETYRQVLRDAEILL